MNPSDTEKLVRKKIASNLKYSNIFLDAATKLATDFIKERNIDWQSESGWVTICNHIEHFIVEASVRLFFSKSYKGDTLETSVFLALDFIKENNIDWVNSTWRRQKVISYVNQFRDPSSNETPDGSEKLTKPEPGWDELGIIENDYKQGETNQGETKRKEYTHQPITDKGDTLNTPKNRFIKLPIEAQAVINKIETEADESPLIFNLTRLGQTKQVQKVKILAFVNRKLSKSLPH